MVRTNSDVFVFFFFFQAEDGIRDVAVTGVQTCALPISCQGGEQYPLVSPVADQPPPDGAGHDRQRGREGDHEPELELAQVQRSEERRVGKECRSRWSP